MAFGAIAAVLLIVALVFLIRHRSCISMQSSRSSTNPALSTIWVRKEGSNGAVVGMNGNGNDKMNRIRKDRMNGIGKERMNRIGKDGMNGIG